MSDLLGYLMSGVGALLLLLFLGGMLSAAAEIRAEKRAGVPVTRPAWRKADRPAKDGPDYSAPPGTWFMWPLVAIGRADVAERLLARRSARS